MVNLVSSSLSSGQVQGRRRGFDDDCEELTARNSEQRSSMLQVAASLSDVANVAVEREAGNVSRSLQDSRSRWREGKAREGKEAKTLNVRQEQEGGVVAHITGTKFSQ